MHNIWLKVFWPPRENIFYDVAELIWSELPFPFAIKNQRQLFYRIFENFGKKYSSKYLVPKNEPKEQALILGLKPRV